MDDRIAVPTLPKGRTELERLNSELTTQDELIGEFDKRLTVVKSPLPEPENATPNDTPLHVVQLVNRVASNNQKLRQLIDELVI